MNKLLSLLAILIVPILNVAQTGGEVPITIKFYQLHGRSSGTALMGNTFFEIHYEVENKKIDTLQNGQLTWKISPAISADYFEVLQPANASVRDSAGLIILDLQDAIIAPAQTSKIELKVNLDKLVRADLLEPKYVFRNQFFQFNTPQGDLIQPDSLWPQVLGTYINYGDSNLELKQDDIPVTEIDPSKPLTADFSFRNRSGYDFDTLNLNLNVRSDVQLKSVDLASATDSLDVQLVDDEIIVFRSNLNNSGNDFFDIELEINFEEGEHQNEDQFELSLNGYTADYQFFHQFNEHQIQLDFLDNTSSTKDFDAEAIQLSYSPNPSAATINFKIKNEPATNFQFEVFDLVGKRHLSKQVGSTFQIEKSELGTGIWFFLIKKEGSIVETGKVIFVGN